ncbi:DUF2971 domain-containing protein [Pseudomonas entomophila]|uniref:DUF2971 domain-containing protein n=1 Tax=Pseudomonas entomophila TaxID=312306 RepID=UPI0023D866D0|nr:DUF2971 domain-containing protein [Pseudomonas entomophila]MDF0729544.1 DUF2971 domain-containing protein [Pseudomonas entomophila]
MELSKFFSVSKHSLDNLKTSTLWFSSPHDFNDPFEGRVAVKKVYSQDTFASRREVEEIVNINQDYFHDKNREFHDHLVSLATLEEKIEFIFNVWGHTLRTLHMDYIAEDGYCCFCRRDRTFAKNQLMWSHYANGLRGFCLVFDKVTLHQSLQTLNQQDTLIIEPVEYRNALPEIDIHQHMTHHFKPSELLGDLVAEFIIKSRSTKSRAWRHEREYRAISSSTGLHSYAPEAVRKILIGEKMPQAQRRKIEAIARTVYSGAHIEHVRLDKDSYQLKIVL